MSDGGRLSCAHIINRTVAAPVSVTWIVTVLADVAGIDEAHCESNDLDAVTAALGQGVRFVLIRVALVSAALGLMHWSAGISTAWHGVYAAANLLSAPFLMYTSACESLHKAVMMCVVGFLFGMLFGHFHCASLYASACDPDCRRHKHRHRHRHRCREPAFRQLEESRSRADHLRKRLDQVVKEKVSGRSDRQAHSAAAAHFPLGAH